MRRADVFEAIDAATAFALERQDHDGLWRDYDLAPGASDAWTSSVVGIALAEAGAPPERLAVARTAVRALRRPHGWGYNSATACDADTTSFALRFVGGDISVLGRYLDVSGRAHTFADARFGSWAWAHSDVTATVGLAAAIAPGGWRTAAAIRSALLSTYEADGSWRSFWWSTDAYAVARSLEFLVRTGGIPRAVVASAREDVARVSPGSAFEAAQLLTIALLVDGPASIPTSELLDLQGSDGGWPSSAVLLVPGQKDGSPGAPHADVRRLHSTSAALTALTSLTAARGLVTIRAGS